MAKGDLHTLPIDDLIEHESSENCVCGPTCIPVERDDGSFGYVFQHHSLDGRELAENES